MVKQYKFINLFPKEINFHIYEINCKKGLDINIKGVPKKLVADLPSKEIALKPETFLI